MLTTLLRLRSSGRRGIDPVQKAWDIIEQLKSIHEKDQNIPLLDAYNIFFDILAVSGLPNVGATAYQKFVEMQQGPAKVVPNLKTYVSVMSVFAYEANPDGVLNVLNQLVQRIGGGDRSVTLTVSPFNVLLRAFGNAKQYEQMEQVYDNILRRSPDDPVQPNTHTFRLAMEAYAYSRNQKQGALDVFEDWLRYSENRSETSRHQLKFINLVLRALEGMPDGADRGEALLNGLLTTFERGESQVHPDTETYVMAVEALLARHEGLFQSLKHVKGLWPTLALRNAALEVMSQTSDPDRLYRVSNFLNMMDRDPLTKPDEKSFRHALYTCATTMVPEDENERAFNVTQSIWKKYQRVTAYHPKDSRCMIHYVDACVNFLPSVPTRETRIQEAFDWMCTCGMVDRSLLAVYKRSVSADLYRVTTGCSPSTSCSLPTRWYRNTLEKYRP
eukprot:Nitzschia sp. Nitz4//scaffold4_size323378//71612//72985//NITZ4_000633-RA/size323378-snap-gene-0.445-mRNA-1//-1//CDS//3329553318//4195//frame0